MKIDLEDQYANASKNTLAASIKKTVDSSVFKLHVLNKISFRNEISMQNIDIYLIANFLMLIHLQPKINLKSIMMMNLGMQLKVPIF